MTASRKRAAFALVVFSSVMFAACGLFTASPAPSITFTRVPSSGLGDPEQVEVITGRVTNARPGQKIVLYARSGDWWIQPYAAQPFTEILSDSTWRTVTHPGDRYAALLVGPDYRPVSRMGALPEPGGIVLAIGTVQGIPAPVAVRKTLQFAGYEWQIRNAPSTPGGTRNLYEPSNAWTDSGGLLHLRLQGDQQHWTSSEVNLLRALGYGSYRFVVRDLSGLEPAEVFTMLTWDDGVPQREMDIEISKWGETSVRNAQFVIQPFQLPANTVQFQAPPGTVTFMLRWAPGRARFRAFRGSTANWNDQPVHEHLFTSGVPAAGNESVHLNHYVFRNQRNPLRHGSEVIVESFEYLP